MLLDIDLSNMWNKVNLPSPWADWADLALKNLDDTAKQSPYFRSSP